MSAMTAPQRKAARNNNSKKSAKGFFFPMFVCVIGGELVTIVLAGFFAFIFALVDLPDVVVTGFVFVALILGALVTGHLCGKAFPQERGTMAIICGLMMTLILVLVNLIFFREPITAMSFAKYAAILVPVFLSAAMTKASKTKNSKKKLKKR